MYFLGKKITSEDFEKAINLFRETKILWDETIPTIENSLMEKSGEKSRQSFRNKYRNEGYNLMSINGDLFELFITTLDPLEIQRRHQSYLNYIAWLAKKGAEEKK